MHLNENTADLPFHLESVNHEQNFWLVFVFLVRLNQELDLLANASFYVGLISGMLKLRHFSCAFEELK